MPHSLEKILANPDSPAVLQLEAEIDYIKSVIRPMEASDE